MIKINKTQFLFLYTSWRYSYRILTRLCLCYAKTMFMLGLCPKHNPNIVKLLIAAQKQKGIIIMGKYLEDHINWSLWLNQTMNRNWNYRKGKSVSQCLNSKTNTLSRKVLSTLASSLLTRFEYFTRHIRLHRTYKNTKWNEVKGEFGFVGPKRNST